eukprot:Seg1027.10 transcript_id=Seg1027.10/GoldUCD/mRNA.D3Y31 product="hypothetical protein" protein_id=Seg1027.10/GoldUCD/D3Y31
MLVWMKGEWSVGTVAWYLKATNAWFWDYSLSNAERRGDARKFAREESESDHIERIVLQNGRTSCCYALRECVCGVPSFYIHPRLYFLLRRRAKALLVGSPRRLSFAVESKVCTQATRIPKSPAQNGVVLATKQNTTTILAALAGRTFAAGHMTNARLISCRSESNMGDGITELQLCCIAIASTL